MIVLAPSRRSRNAAALTGLSIALVLPAILSAGAGGNLPGRIQAASEIAINEAVVWALALAIMTVVIVWERRPLSSIGLVRPSWTAFLYGGGVMAGLLILALGAATLIQSAGFPVDNDTQARLVIGLPIWLQIFVAISAGVTEEILFRGYPIERITELTGNRWVGAIVPIIAFGAVHAPFWGVAHAVVAGLQGMLLTIVYLWRRNLWTNITAHALLDGFVFVVLDVATSHGTTNL